MILNVILDNYVPCEVTTLGNSCMRHSYCQKYFDIYTENEDVCSLLVLKESDKVKGRALLWVLDNGDFYMDRIYTASDSDKHLFEEWADEHNYRKYSNDHKSKSVEVEESSYDYYPYMDTFYSFDTNDNTLRSNDGGSDCIKLQDTNGGYKILCLGDYEVKTLMKTTQFILNQLMIMYTKMISLFEL